MKILIAFLFTLALVGIVEAKPTPHTPLTLKMAVWIDSQEPVPAQFDINKVGIPKNVIIRYVDWRELRKACAVVKIAPRSELYACTLINNPYRVFIDNELKGRTLQIVLRHEYAHVLGWHEH